MMPGRGAVRSTAALSFSPVLMFALWAMLPLLRGQELLQGKLYPNERRAIRAYKGHVFLVRYSNFQKRVVLISERTALVPVRAHARSHARTPSLHVPDAGGGHCSEGVQRAVRERERDSVVAARQRAERGGVTAARRAAAHRAEVGERVPARPHYAHCPRARRGALRRRCHCRVRALPSLARRSGTRRTCPFPPTTTTRPRRQRSSTRP
jgi:hypothetical protein